MKHIFEFFTGEKLILQDNEFLAQKIFRFLWFYGFSSSEKVQLKVIPNQDCIEQSNA